MCMFGFEIRLTQGLVLMTGRELASFDYKVKMIQGLSRLQAIEMSPCPLLSLMNRRLPRDVSDVGCFTTSSIP